MAVIKSIFSREILNGKGNPTVETSVILSDDSLAIASVPKGTTVGTYESSKLYDKDENRFRGKGVLKAVGNVNTVISPKLIGLDANNQALIDKTMIELDSTTNKERLGANAILSVSMAVAKAAALSNGLPLFSYLRQITSKNNQPFHMPIPVFTLINGGPHNSSNLNFQDFLVMPASSTSYTNGLHMVLNIYHGMKETLMMENLPIQISDEGGYTPALPHNMEAFFLISRAVDKVSLRMGFDVFLGIDSSATNFYKSQEYKISDKDGAMSAKSFTLYYDDLVKQFHVLYFEDPLSEDDWEGWTEMTRVLSQHAIIVADDLVATNPYRLQTAIDKKAATAVSIKPTQIGTVIESLAVAEAAIAGGLKIVVSSRSGETNDDFISDFALAIGADYVKFGAPARGEHIAKYNRLLEIEALIQKTQS